MESRVFTEIGGNDSQQVYESLSRIGFRRSHSIVYRPQCPNCRACIPARVVAGEFSPGRTMRRLLNANAHITVREQDCVATVEQYQIFKRYLLSRHGEGNMASMNYAEYRDMIEDTPVTSRIAEFRDPNGDLVAACLTDYLEDGLSAVYSFFDPDLSQRSLGTFMILWLIERTAALSLPYAYLGYWVANSRKMAYKARFRPLELMDDKGNWYRLADH